MEEDSYKAYGYGYGQMNEEEDSIESKIEMRDKFVTKKKESPFVTEKDWNERYQSLLEESHKDPSNFQNVSKQLNELSQQFADEAAKISKIIIEEMFVDLEAKTIKPCTTEVGGFAGGEKVSY